ncbi:MAG TPA: DNA polymerase III subunit delta [Mycobacteriales bacterium]|nr:DNA polymerase III subunit delta [Mycobacteriales bacterium]
MPNDPSPPSPPSGGPPRPAPPPVAPLRGAAPPPAASPRGAASPPAGPPRPAPRADLRLAVPALGAWLAAALAAVHPRLTVATLALVTLAYATVLLRRVPRRHAALGAAALACAAAATLATTARNATRDGPLAALARDRAVVTLDLAVTADPRPLTGRVVGAQRVADTTLVLARAERVRRGPATLALRRPVTVFAPPAGWAARLPGERLRVTGRLRPSLDRDAGPVFEPFGRPVRLRAPSLAARTAGRLRAGLRDAAAVLPAEPRGLLPGLVVGDTTRLDPALREDFRRTGLTHVVAVSGQNVAILLAAVLLAARRIGVGPRTAAVAGAAALAFFVVLARPSPSVLRAAAMGGLGLAATVTGRERAAVRLLAAAVLFLVLLDPALARSLGFALSTAATAGLLLLGPPWRARLARRLPGWLADAVATPLAAQVACAPVLAAAFGRVSLVAVPVNVAAAPAVAPATVAGVAAAALAPLSPALARLAARAGGIPAAWLVRVAHTGSRLPAAQLGVPTGLTGAALTVAALAALAALLRRPRTRRLVATVAAAVTVAGGAAWTLSPGWPPAGWRFVACDVGQGDALVVRTTAGAVLVDAGPDPVAVDRCLRDLGVARFAAVVLTHFHADHVEGLPGALRGRRTPTVAVGPLAEPADERARVATWTAARRVPVRVAALGERWRAGDAAFDVLGPEAPFHGTASDPNNSSLVLRVTLTGLVLLLTGDVEEPAQLALLARGPVGHADVLKVPHHGSARQTAEFLDATGAAAAVVSVGRGNPYGHPAAATLGALAGNGMRTFRTDRDGDVAVTGRTGRVRVTGRRGRGLPPRRDPRAMAFAAAVERRRATAPALWCPVPPSSAPGRPGTARPPSPGPAARAPPRHPPWHHDGVPATTALAPVTLVHGDEELLVSRAVAAVVAAARARDPQVDVRDLPAAAADAATLSDLQTPSLFGELRLLVLRGVQDCADEVRDALLPLVQQPAEDAVLVLVHAGGVKAKKFADAVKAAGAQVVPCAKVDKLGDRLAFVQAEFDAARVEVTAGACRAIVDAVGGDLRELAGACGQLVADTVGTVDERAVARFFRGRADASGFAVADRALEGDVPGSLVELRQALAAGVDPVLVVAALARQLRTVAKVASAGRGRADAVAKDLKLAPWMVDKARRQSRGWAPDSLAAAHAAVAAADGEVKGGGTDPQFAVERAVLAVASSCGMAR